MRWALLLSLGLLLVGCDATMGSAGGLLVFATLLTLFGRPAPALDVASKLDAPNAEAVLEAKPEEPLPDPPPPEPQPEEMAEVVEPPVQVAPEPTPRVTRPRVRLRAQQDRPCRYWATSRARPTWRRCVEE